ncbi:hypothetical protein Trydic_g19756 [Trypoxylus dichotomus]
MTSSWLRYEGDTFLIPTHGEDKLQDFFSHFNSINPKITFTMETVNRNQLSFLDVLIIKKQAGTLGHAIYRKATHTNCYLNAQSHHHSTQIQGVAKTLVTADAHPE